MKDTLLDEWTIELKIKIKFSLSFLYMPFKFSATLVDTSINDWNAN